MVYLVGMGPGSVNSLTLEAVEILRKSDKIISFGRVGEIGERLGLRVEKVGKISDVENIISREISESKEIEKNITILASGDPGFYGILDYLKTHNIAVDKVVSGISSIQYMCAKLQISWQDALLTSLHGRDEDLKKTLSDVSSSAKSIILTDKKNNPNLISNCLYKKGVRGVMYVGFDLSYDDELIVEAHIGEEIDLKSELSVVVVCKR